MTAIKVPLLTEFESLRTCLDVRSEALITVRETPDLVDIPIEKINLTCFNLLRWLSFIATNL